MKPKRKRIASLFVAMVMVFAMFPSAALAAASEPKLTSTKVNGLVQDSLEYTFEPDPAAVGEWEAYDFMNTIPEQYDPNRSDRISNISAEGWLGVSVYSDGTATNHHKGGSDMDLSWTVGYFIWEHSQVVPGYQIQEVDGGSYMFVEWKAGDYQRTGEVPAYYILAKVSDVPAPLQSPPTTDDDLATAASWAREGIQSAVAKGFVPSDIQGDYASVITRQEFCRMAVKFVEYRTGKEIDAVLAERGLSRNANIFTDTSDPDILAAYALGITNGTSSNTFTPDGQFSREQAATMLMNTCKVIGMETGNAQASGFADIDSVASWAVAGVNFCFDSGVMNGTGDNNFSPKGTYTRQEAIVTFDRIK